jgi:hypothetical protein
MQEEVGGLIRPSFQFYPGDWLKDPNLRMCSLAARGLWTDMLCFMHQGTPYGYLKVGNKVILPDNLARMVGTTIDETNSLLRELEDAEVFSRDEEGCIFSRRLIRDEEIRQARAAGGVKGGNPALMKGAEVQGRLTLEDNQNPTPSSSSSSSSSSSTASSREKKTVRVSEDAKRLATILYDWLKEKDAVPAVKGWFMRQAGIAENQLLKAHNADEWEACLEWAKDEPYWSLHLSSLAQLGDKVWPQYARRVPQASGSGASVYNEFD